uniref:Uncharacterized protein n=1 Tax=Glossina pallidipes TaxID=7398 RepID=A0A1A9ZC22_GLOPL
MKKIEEQLFDAFVCVTNHSKENHDELKGLELKMQIHGTSASLLQKVVKTLNSVQQQFRQARKLYRYLYGRNIRQESNSTNIFISEGIIKSVSKLENFDYEIRIRKASEHTSADMLSRLLFKDQRHRIEGLVEEEVLAVLPVIVNILQEALNNDKETKNLIDCVTYQ